MGRARSRTGGTRDAILDAAVALVSEVGAGRVTLDAVAERAGVSKGGLLYNFPSKESLLQGMIARFVEETGRVEAEMRDVLAPSPNRAVQALLSARLECMSSDGKATANGLLAAVAQNPRLLDPVREAHHRTRDTNAEGSDDPDFDRVLWLAVEGLAFLELMDVSPFAPEERARIIETVADLGARRQRPPGAPAGA